MKFLPWSLSLLALRAKVSTALFEDEAGVTDFTISTAGHGVLGVTYAQTSSDQRAVLTSSSSPHGVPLGVDVSSDDVVGCHVSSRSLKDASLLWRRNVCSSPNGKHAVYSKLGNEKFYTLEDNGLMRIWNDTNGAMTAEFPWTTTGVVPNAMPRIVDLGHGSLGGILSKGDTEVLVVMNDGGYEGTVVSAVDVLKNANVKAQKTSTSPLASIVASLLVEDDVYVVAAWTHDGATTSFAEMALVKISTASGDGGAVQVSQDCKSLAGASKTSLVLSSIIAAEGKIEATAVGEDGVLVSYSYSDKSESTSSAAGISVKCENMTVESGSLGLDEIITSMHKLQCTQFFVTLLASTADGKTSVFTVKRGKKAELQWEAEEGLANADSAIFLDKGVAQIENSEDDEANILASLSFEARLSSQWENLVTFVTGGFIDNLTKLVGGNIEAGAEKEAFFGLNKVIVVLSNHFNKVMLFRY